MNAGSVVCRAALMRLSWAVFTLFSTLSAQETPSLVVTLATDTVDDLDHETSLREAITYAATLVGANTVTFDAALDGATISLTGGHLLTADGAGITLDATNLGNGLTLASTGASRVVLNTGGLTLRGLTLTGAALTGGQGGGAIYSSGTLVLDRCTLIGNSADFGGGALFNDGVTTITRSTLSGNSTAGVGGAVYINSGSLTVFQSTITGNSAASYSIHNGATAAFHHCTIAGNTASGVSGGIRNATGAVLNLENTILGGGNSGSTDLVNEGTVQYTGANLAQFAPTGAGTFNGSGPILATPLLAPLGDYGGPTHTRPPLADSPALDAAVGSTETTDQRGESRPKDGDGDGSATADLGAVELVSDNADFASLVLSAGAITPALSDLVRDYVADVPPGTTSVTITPTLEHVEATVTVNGVAVASGEASGSLPLNVGRNPVSLVVTSPAGTTKTFSLVLIRPTHVVTSTAGSGPGSLVELVSSQRFSSFETYIVFGPNLNGAVISTSSPVSSTNNQGSPMTIDASSLPDGLTIANNGSSVVLINTSVLTVRGLTLTGGSDLFSAAGISNAGIMTVENCTITGNRSGLAGGGVFNRNFILLRNSTISGNWTFNNGSGGGLYNEAGTARLEHCVVKDNTSSFTKGIHVLGGTVELENSVVADNKAGEFEGDITNFGTLAVTGTNIIKSPIGGNAPVGGGVILQVDPVLGPLADNGGPTRTHYPAADSPVLDAATATSPLLDQRSRPRPFDGDGDGTALADLGPVEYLGSLNANLSSLVTSEGSLDPAFDSSTMEYRVLVPETTTEITVTPTAADATALLTVNGIPLASGAQSHGIAIGPGDNLIEIVVTAQDPRHVNTFTLTVAYPSDNTDLAALSLSAGSLSPALSAGVTSYTASVPYDTTGITVTPTTDQAYATVTVNSVPVDSGTASGVIPLSVGDNEIRVEVTSESGGTVQTYTLTVQRQGNAALGALALSDGTLLPAFDPDITSYTIELATSMNGISLTPTAVDENASITVDGLLVASGEASNVIALNPGVSLITLVVSTPPGPGTRTYMLNVLTPYLVSTTSDSGPGSLRQTVLEANTTERPDVIEFSPALSGQTVTITGGAILITRECVLDASGLPAGIVLHGNLFNPMFGITSGVPVTMKGLTITNSGNPGSENTGAIYSFGPLTLIDCGFFGNAAPAGYGGAVYAGSDLTMLRCVVSGNTALHGGGVTLGGSGVATISHSTFEGNTSLTNGGAILNLSRQMVVDHCTFSGNQATDNGGGIALAAAPATLSLKNSIVAGNTAPANPDIHNPTSVAMLGANIVQQGVSGTVDTTQGSFSMVNPELGPLGDYGGRTHTLLLLPGSPAINASVDSVATHDQRGLAIVGVADIGAYEFGADGNSAAYSWEHLPVTATEAERADSYDYDNDGQTNGEEWQARTDPDNAESRFQLGAFTPNGGNVDVTVATAMGRSYRFETSPSLADDSWTPAGSAFAGTGGEVTTTLGPFPEWTEVFIRIRVSVP